MWSWLYKRLWQILWICNAGKLFSNFDILGPLPESNSSNKYILLVTNYFMNWREANTIPNHEAVMVTSKIVDEFVSRFGMPWQLHSDQGRNF